MIPRFVAAACTFVLFAWSASAADLRVDANYENGSAKVMAIDQKARSVEFRPGGVSKEGWPCWWSLHVAGLEPGETLTLILHPAEAPLSFDWASPNRAAWSVDGEKWEQTEPGQREKGAMTYQIKVPGEHVSVAWGPVYTPALAAAAVKKLAEASQGAATAETLTTSREGRPVPMLHISEGPLPKAQRPALWFSARQHAWESGGSWVAQGLAEWLMSPAEAAKWLRQNTEIFLVPVMDVDHVAHGEGGKNGQPQDHNRDWSDDPHWPEVRAAQALITRLAEEGRFRSFIDFHNPAPNDRELHIYLPPDEAKSEAQAESMRRYEALARERITPVMPMMARPKISGPGYDPNWKKMSHNWVALHAPSASISFCIETPWNLPQSNQAGYRKIGAAAGEAMSLFLHP